MRSIIRYISVAFISAAFLLNAPFCANAQLRVKTDGAFVNNAPAGTMANNKTNTDSLAYGDDTTSHRPSYTLKRYFKALAHKDSMRISHMFWGQAILPGTGQIYNRQTWKLPIIYGVMGGCIGGAVASNIKYQKDGKKGDKNLRDALVIGAAATYWGSIIDAAANYKSYQNPLPARATIYSALVPGLGQAYNGDYWHIPLYYAGFMISGYCWAFNQKQYKRYKQMYIDANAGNYTGSLTTDDMIWYRDQYRRNRDYSIVSTILIYVLNIVDANVFAHFNNFDIDDNISFSVHPAPVQYITPSALQGAYSYDTHKIGVQMNITF